ncbi:hypothetical protein RJ640_009373 [Escallonia rubra]|uniref:Fe2OG dioxygenase domain-containing protein n=1 Tax=Escallonia rubra TaxID=112253 RepID=A0AA88QKT8_9ASTE|nr:hypothetical protein RJ640_009373 [Escallonia rubra]
MGTEVEDRGKQEDAGTVTFLLQDNDISGLWIKHRGGWVPVKPVSDALVLNIGDAWSNGVYRSIEHRAVTNDRKARISVATFVFPENEAELGPSETMVENFRSKNVKFVDFTEHFGTQNGWKSP